MKAIVLSGGGSRGAYQIGVWKALRKLGIKYDIVTGTSVGALNAALMVQNTFYKALYFWNVLTFSNVVDEDIEADTSKLDIYKKYLNSSLSGGMKISNLEKTISKALIIRKIYKSKIDLGIVTVKSDGLKPVLLTKKNISPNELKDYLVASASCYPAFAKKKIDGEEYIDGGLYDNLPINLAINMGATEIIAVDLESIGFKKKPKDKDIPITYIKPNNDIGSFLIFDKKNARRAIRFGYNDTMKVFGLLDGDKYTFKKGLLDKMYLKQKDKFREELLKNKDLLEIGLYKKILENKNWKKDYIKIIEQLGNIFEVDESYIYDINKFNKKVIESFNETKEIDNIKKFIQENDLKDLMNKKILIKKLYYSINKKYISLFSKEYLMIIYLKIINSR